MSIVLALWFVAGSGAAVLTLEQAVATGLGGPGGLRVEAERRIGEAEARELRAWENPEIELEHPGAGLDLRLTVPGGARW